MTRLQTVAAYIGRRGTVLLVFGVIWALIAYGILIGSSERAVTPNEALFHVMLPVWVRVLLWGGSAVIAVVAALILTPRFQAAGYVALFIPPAERALSYMGGWVISVLTEGGAPGAWVPGLMWVVVSCFVVIESRTQEQWPPAIRRHAGG